MGRYIIAYDLGTGGNKASLYDGDGRCLSDAFVAYDTLYPAAGWHEQRPEDWWRAVVESTRKLMAAARVAPADIEAIGISGHSLGVVPLDAGGRLLRETTPIWSDARPGAEQTRPFFAHVEETAWYRLTGNGFPPPLYSVFKLMWYRDREPDMFGRIHKVVGTKDFVNHRLTGRMVTDYSYASGSGVYDLTGWRYSEELIRASGLPPELYPEIVPATEVIGGLTPEAAEALGLPRAVKVVAGGVDNACMALGAKAFQEGRVYNSLGSSSWVAVSAGRPVLDERSRPYVFTHVVPGMFASAVGVFSTGTSFRWLRDQVCRNLAARAEAEGANPYDLMTRLAAESPAGARKLLFNPSMAGGSSLDPSPNIRGAFLGLDLGHSQADLIRAAMEGIGFALRLALDELRRVVEISGDMVVVGGGSHSALWRQIYADLYDMNVVKTNVDQNAAALGAAATAAVGTGLWRDFTPVDAIHEVEDVTAPDPAHQAVYARLLPVYARATRALADLGDRLAAVEL